MNRWWKLALFVSIIAWLVACNPSEVEVSAVPPTQTLTDTATAAALSTGVPTTLPTTTPLPTLLPTEMSTAVPSATPTPLPETSLLGSAWGGPETGFQVVDQLGGRIKTVTVQNGIAYVGVGARLLLLDVSQPTSPLMLGQSDILPGLISYVAVLNNTAYIVTNPSGFWIVDVSRPNQPQIVDFFETDGPIYFLRAWNGRLYVDPRARDQNKAIFSVDDPLHPVQIGELPKDYRPLANDQYVYATKERTENQTTFLVADATDPNNLGPVTEITVDLNAFFIGADGDQFYFVGTDVTQSLWVMDRHDSTNTLTRLDIELPGSLGKIQIVDQIIYVQENFAFADTYSYGSNIEAFDVSADSVRPLEPLPAGNRSYEYFVADGIIYVPAGEMLIIAGFNEERDLEKLSEWRSLGSVDWVAANGEQIIALNIYDNHLYQFAADSTQGLQLIHQHKRRYTDEAVLNENVLFTTALWQGIDRFQIDVNPWQETAVFKLPPDREFFHNMAIHGDYLYVFTMVSTSGNLIVLDISNPAELQQVGELEITLFNPQLTIDNDRLFVWTDYGYGHEFQVFSIADPAKPEQIALWEDPLDTAVSDIVVRDNLVYLLTPSLLRIIDISDVANMTVIASLPIVEGTTHLTLLDDKLLLTGDKISLVDVTDPTQPDLIGELAIPGEALDAVMHDGLIYVANGAAGLMVLRPLPSP